jgi:large-conductance mechanosensitive channel
MSNENEILEELKKIHKLLSPPPSSPKAKNILEELKRFLDKHQVMGLAVAFILGISIFELAQSLAFILVMPIIGLGNPIIHPLVLMGNLITFIIVVLLILLIVKLTTHKA